MGSRYGSGFGIFKGGGSGGGGTNTNIGTNDLTIGASGTRKLTMGGALVTDLFNLRNSADTQNIFSFGGEGTMAIGLNALNTGAGSDRCVVIGKNATNSGQITSVAIGDSAQVLGQSGVAVGGSASANWRSTAVGLSANASAGQYNVAIGNASLTSFYYNVAVGMGSSAYNAATAVGGGAQALGESTIALGRSAVCSLAGKRGITIGHLASSTNTGAIALGFDTLSSGLGSIAIGSGIETTGNHSITLGALAYAANRTVADTHAFTVFLEDATPTLKFHRDNDSWFDSTGSFGFNTMTPDASALVQMDSTTKGFLPPTMRTGEKTAISSPATGLMVYDTDVLELNTYNGTSWVGGGGSNIGTSDLTISATGVRKLQMFGGLTTDSFNLRNSADTNNLFSFGGDGTFTIGLGANNSGGSSLYNVVIGNSATNNGMSNTTLVGYLAQSTAVGGTAIGRYTQVLSNYGTSVGYNAKSGLSSVAIGNGADASVGQYNIAIGEGSSCAAYFGVAIGRYSSAGHSAVAIRGTAGGYATAVNGTSVYHSVAVGLGSDAQGTGATAIGNSTIANTFNTTIGYGMQSTTGYSVVIGSCPYGSTRVNTVANTFSWFTNNVNPIVRLGETADQWNIGTGSFGYGTMTPDASAVIDLSSTSKGFLPPRMTTTERDAIGTPAEGLVVYNTTTQVLNFYNGATWGAV